MEVVELHQAKAFRHYVKILQVEGVQLEVSQEKTGMRRNSTTFRSKNLGKQNLFGFRKFMAESKQETKFVDFSFAKETYAKFRPDYPEELFQEIYKHIEGGYFQFY